MQATMLDLNNVLFEQLERINDDDLHGTELDEQLKKTKAITGVAEVIVKNAAVVLQAHKVNMEYGGIDGKETRKMLLGESNRSRLPGSV